MDAELQRAVGDAERLARALDETQAQLKQAQIDLARTPFPPVVSVSATFAGTDGTLPEELTVRWEGAPAIPASVTVVTVVNVLLKAGLARRAAYVEDGEAE